MDAQTNNEPGMTITQPHFVVYEPNPESQDLVLDCLWQRVPSLFECIVQGIHSWDPHLNAFSINPSPLSSEALLRTSENVHNLRPKHEIQRSAEQRFEKVLASQLERVNPILDEFSPHWCSLSRTHRQVVQRHTIRTFICLLCNPLFYELSSTEPIPLSQPSSSSSPHFKYQSGALSEDQNTLLWVVLFHDIEKELPKGPDGGHTRDPFHPFRSGPAALRNLLQVFHIKVEEKKVAQWEKEVRQSFVHDHSTHDRHVQIHDNDRLPFIVASLCALLKSAVPADARVNNQKDHKHNTHQVHDQKDDKFLKKLARVKMIVLIILLHQSFDSVRDYPNKAVLHHTLLDQLFFGRSYEDNNNNSPTNEKESGKGDAESETESEDWRLSEEESKQFFRLIRVFGMADSLSYGMFRPDLSYFYLGEINRVFLNFIENFNT